MPEVARVAEFIHFACTSEDINNLAHGLMLAAARRDVLLPALARHRRRRCAALAHAHAGAADARAHARPAGDADDARQGDRQRRRAPRARRSRRSSAVPLPGKINGAVGNYNAHVVAYPDVDWEALAATRRRPASASSSTRYTTQIEPHDCMAELFDADRARQHRS